MHLMVLCLLVSSCAIQTGTARRPGLQLTFTQNGLEVVSKVAINELTQRLKSKHINNIEGKSKLHVGKVEYSIKNIVLKSFTNPSSKVNISPGLGCTWAVKGASISLHGDWHVKYKYAFIHISDHGSLDVDASDVSFRVSFQMGMDKNHKPTIFTTACSSDVGRAKVRFHGGASWLYNLFDRSIDKKLKKGLKHVISTGITKLVNIDAEKYISKQAVVTLVGKHLQMDYGLTQAPVFNTGSLQSMHKGEITWTSDPKPFLVYPVPFPALTNHSHMLYIMASEYILNSASNAMYTHGRISYNVSSKSLPKGKAGILNTTCHTIGTSCFGNFLSRVAKMYPNSSLTIYINTTQAPYLQILPKGINLTVDAEMTFRAKTPKKNIVYLFRLGVSFNLSVHVWMEGSTVKANYFILKSDVKIIDTKVGHLSSDRDQSCDSCYEVGWAVNLQFIFNVAYDKFINTKLKEIGIRGIEMPSLKHVSYLEPKMTLNKGSVTFATNFQWIPKGEKSKFPDMMHEENQL